jgi:hypothetical protein
MVLAGVRARRDAAILRRGRARRCSNSRSSLTRDATVFAARHGHAGGWSAAVSGAIDSLDLSTALQFSVLAMSDAEGLVRDFESGLLGAGRFGHREHLWVAHAYLQMYPLEEALARFVARLKALTLALGVPEKFHATISWGYMIMIDEAMRRAPGVSFEVLLANNPLLLQPPAAALQGFYSRAELESDEARRRFVLPRQA